MSKHKNNGQVFDIAFNRFDEAHRAWHLAMEGYHNVDDFRAGINSAIQSLRNITFALQKQKDNLDDFDFWYGEWQKKMSEDLILKELCSARTDVVHRDDLKLKSTGIVKIKNWIDLEKMSFKFDPTNDSDSIAKGLYNTYLKYYPVPKELKNRLIFEFERQWIYDKLPDHELLEALTYGINFFYKMLRDGEEKFSLLPNDKIVKGNYCNGELTKKQTFRCMMSIRYARTLMFSFETGEKCTAVVKNFEITEPLINSATKRYGNTYQSKDVLDLIEGIFREDYPFNEVKAFVQIAITSLKRDKFLVPVSFIFCGEGKEPIIISHNFTNQEEKIMSISKLGDEIIKYEGLFVLNISEAWIAKIDKQRPNVMPHMRKDKREGILIHISSSEKIINVTIPFKRNIWGGIVFSKPTVEESTSEEVYRTSILCGIVEALKMVKDLNK